MTKGFTLIELIIAMAIFGILATASTVILTATIRTSENTLSTAAVRDEAAFISNSIVNNVRFAQVVSCPSSTSMVVSSTRAGWNPITYSCLGSSGDEYIASGSARLNSDQVEVINCDFTCSSNLVNISFTVQSKTSTADAVIYDTSVVLRNSP